MLIPTLETDRLSLVPPSGRHLGDYLDFYRNAEASKFYGGPLSEQDTWLKLARDVGHWHLRGYGLWILENKTTDQVIGGCGLFLHEGWCWPELTWWILPGARRQGYAKEASAAAINFGYNSLKWQSVRTYMIDENLAAQSLVRTMGGIKVDRRKFPDGIKRDIYEFPKP